MNGQRIGYVRVSTMDQNELRQLEGQVLDRAFTDKASGRDTARPQLTELLRFVFVASQKSSSPMTMASAGETVYQYLRQAALR